jgi:hypothetical protein
MKTKQFRSILAVAVMAASITTSLTPAQAFTWDDFWQSFKQGLESSPSLNSPQQAEGSNQIPQAAPQKNNYAESSSNPIINCVKANGRDSYNLGQDDPGSIVSVGRSAMKAYSSISIYPGSPHGTTCSIDVHPSDEKVAYAFAIPDNSGINNMRFTIYVDGQQKISKIISRGQVGRYMIDTTGANSYAFTLEALNGSGDIYLTY